MCEIWHIYLYGIIAWLVCAFLFHILVGEGITMHTINRTMCWSMYSWLPLIVMIIFIILLGIGLILAGYDGSNDE